MVPFGEKPNSMTLNSISLQRGTTDVLSGLSYQLASGEALQIVGENGTGKTSLLRALAGLLPLLEGDICWNHVSIYSMKKDYYDQMLYVGHNNSLKPVLTTRENLLLDKSLYSHPIKREVDEVLDKLDLSFVFDRRVECLSAGQQRKLALAKLFMFEASLWILDEPFVTLDKTTCQLLEEEMQAELRRGTLIIFTSHQALVLADTPVKQIRLSYD